MLWNLGFLVCVALIQGFSSTANLCKKPPSSTPEITANITCEKTLRVFVDGKQIGEESEGYATVSNYVIEANSSVVGLSCYTNQNGGILGSFSNGLITNASWRCSDVAQEGWHKAGFDDSSWLPGVVHSVNAYNDAVLSFPRGPMTDITDGAAWIWTANNTIKNSTVYCRFELRKRDTSELCGPNADLYRSEHSFLDRSLQGSVIRTTKSISSIGCALRCQRTPQCVSFNFEYGSEINPKTCELNSKSARMSPSDVIGRKGFMYYDAILY